ncbi:MAG TPA: SH3 domain-containing protein [Anaerolineales bacterium]|nr:SH3 domain-containing protein [Anaerolineales bacterium]
MPNLNSGGGDATATVEVPTTTATVAIVEDTPTPTLTPTETPIPFTDTPQVKPEITLTKNSNCRMGPNNRYNIIDQIAQGKVLPVIGRNEDNTWWQVINPTNRECWIFNENATPNTDFSSLPIGNAPPLPGTPLNFLVVDQLCQPGPKKFSVTLRWSSGGNETAFRLYRDGKRILELKAGKFNYKDNNAPFNKNITYEIEAVNENGTSERAALIVPACK